MVHIYFRSKRFVTRTVHRGAKRFEQCMGIPIQTRRCSPPWDDTKANVKWTTGFEGRASFVGSRLEFNIYVWVRNTVKRATARREWTWPAPPPGKWQLFRVCKQQCRLFTWWLLPENAAKHLVPKTRKRSTCNLWRSNIKNREAWLSFQN